LSKAKEMVEMMMMKTMMQELNIRDIRCCKELQPFCNEEMEMETNPL